MTRVQMDIEMGRLKTLSQAELEEEYARTFNWSGSFPGPAFSRRRLAYRVQRKFFGGLSPTEEQFFDRLAEHDPVLKSGAKPRKTSALPPRGVTYVREYKGKVYEAKAAGYNQYEMDGKLYPSLTACVKAITGQHSSGRRWFKLKGAL